MSSVSVAASSTVGLERDDLAATPAAVGGDDDVGLGVVDPIDDGLGGKAAEDDRVRSADPGAGEHGDDQLWNHRHVKRNTVALLHAERP